MPRIDVERVLAGVTGSQLIPFVESLGYGPAVRSGSEHKILCPFHDDHKPSLTINSAKREYGLFKCFSCGWNGSIVDFVGAVYRIEDDFLERVRKIAELSGQDPAVRERPKGVTEQRQSRAKAAAPATMTPREVAKAYGDIVSRAVDPAPYAAKLGVEPKAMELAGAVVFEYSPDRMVLAIPMRRPDFVMTSIRFRCFRTRKRWSLAEKATVDGERVVAKGTVAGLLMPAVLPSLEFYHTIIVEGETDLLGGMTIMLRTFGDDVFEWPMQFIGLPGALSCHELVTKLKLGSVTTFFDADEAGARASFDSRRRTAVRDDDGVVIKDEQGRMVQRLDLESDRSPGLLSLLHAARVDARASRPPKLDGRKFDLREMARSGWTFGQFEDHLLRTSTRDPLGMRFKR